MKKIKEHIWESYAAGFSYESGHLNVSECIVCKVQTRKYLHGDFAEKEIAEQEIQDKYDCPGYDPHEQVYEENEKKRKEAEKEKEKQNKAENL